MTGAIVGTAIVFFPAAPLFLFMHGKDISIPKGTEITAYINGNVPVDVSKFAGGATSLQSAGPAGTSVPASATATLDISSTPLNADIEVDGSFIGNTPSSFGIAGGEHTVKISKSGYKPWERKVKTSTGAARLAAELEAMPAGYVPAPAAAPRTVEADRTTPVLVNAAVASVPVPAQTMDRAKRQSAGMAVAGGENGVEESKPYPDGLTTKEQSSICVKVGIKTEAADMAGARIFDVAIGGVAEHVGLHVGYVINSIDGRAVAGPAELETELQNRPPGTKVRVGYMFQSSAMNSRMYYSNEAVLQLPPR